MSEGEMLVSAGRQASYRLSDSDGAHVRRRKIWYLVALLVVVGALILSICQHRAHQNIAAMGDGKPLRETSQPASGATRLKLAASYGRLPLRFEVNEGQTASPVRFLARGNGYALFLTPTESVFTLQGPAEAGSTSVHTAQQTVDTAALRPGRSAALKMKLLGANPSTSAKGLEVLPGKSNYFIGHDPKRWRTNVPNFAKVRLEGVYPGVDLVYYGNQRQLEYDFIVAPGADPSVIHLGFVGARQLEIDPQGELKLQTSVGEVRWHKPVVYQEVDGTRQVVDGHFLREGKESVGFEVASYDPRRPLIIDPQLVYSTYLGGSGGGETGVGIAVDSSGNAYVTGSTASTDFPTTAGAFQLAIAGSGVTNAFVTKLDASGSALIYSTYLGGSGGDQGTGIAVDSSGNAYVTGSTYSTDFPTFNPIQSTAGGSADAFVTKLNAAGNALVYSTYLGGSNEDAVGTDGIAVDSAGNAYVTGRTYSPDFPTFNAFQPTSGGSEDAFVAKLNAAGSALVYSTFLGGSGTDVAVGIAVDSSGNAYVTGGTYSINFPTLSPLQASYAGGGGDAFVTKLNNSGTGLIFSTFLGGSDSDQGAGIAVDSSSNVYVVGVTRSTNFATTLGAFQTASGGGNDAFVTELFSAGNGILYSTYLGGSSGEQGLGIALDPTGKVYVVGSTNSGDFPTVDPAQMFFAGGTSDTFVAEIDPTAVGSASLVYSTYLGGSGTDPGRGIAVDSSGAAYVTGASASADFPTTAGSFQPTFGGGINDAFVAKLAGNTVGLPASITATAGTSQSTTIGTAFGTLLQATVTDASGKGVPSATVTFTAPSSGASGTFSGGFASVSVTTASSGVATAPTFTANTVAGGYTVNASVSGVATMASFSLTNNPGPPASITATAGTPQSAMISTAFATALKATVKDASGNAVPNATVTFAAPSSGASGTFSGGATTAATDSSGVGTAPTFTANSIGGGPYSVTASVTGVAIPATFALTNVDFDLQPAVSGTTQVTDGTPANVTLNITTTPSGAALPADVNYTCSVPASLTGATCALNPTKTSAGSTSGSTTLTITTKAYVPPPFRHQPPSAPYLLWIMAATLAALAAMFLATRQRPMPLRGLPVYLSLALLVITMAGLFGCSSSSTSTPKGPATINVTSTSGALSKTTTININVN